MIFKQALEKQALEKQALENKLAISKESPSIFLIKDIGRFLFIKEKGGKIFDDSFELILDEEESEQESLVDFYAFKFGRRFYYSDKKKVHLIPFRNLGKASQEFIEEFCHLGIHGENELLNGSKDYSTWCKKALFHNILSLGICERNTLAGVLDFQLKCKKNKIKPIIGESVVVKSTEGSNAIFKLFVENEEGWFNLLKINKEINIDNFSFIAEESLLLKSEGLVLVIDPKYFLFDSLKIRKYLKSFKRVYYQIDSVVFDKDDKDKDYLLNLQKFINSSFEPILISDAYYIDRDDYEIKIVLNQIADKRDPVSKNQYFKDYEDQLLELSPLFEDKFEIFSVIIEKARNNTINVKNDCNFEISTSKKYFPEFKLTPEQVEIYGDKECLFWSLIQKGIESKLPKNFDKDLYYNRIQTEFEVIQSGNFFDYFLILWDIIDWSQKNGILCGVGRGSSAGSLIAFLLDLVKIDPIKYDLLFERFLNTGRVAKGASPDIDSDFPASRRIEVKHYIESKYGINHVCSVGTYTSLQLKAAIKDLSRQESINIGTLNYITSVLDIEDNANPKWEELFLNAINKPQLKSFILEHPNIIENIELCLGQPKSTSVHACAMIIVSDNKTIFEQIPVRWGEKDGEKILVSEWQGEMLADAGYLKEDILGIQQLDKFAFILDLIKKTADKDIDIYKIPLDDKRVYYLFQEGYNADSFHFGSKGLTNYSKDVKPENIEDLIAMIALYRPGVMESNMHNEYVFLKEGKKEPRYDFGLEEVTRNTYSIIIFQEQIMQACSILGGFDLVEADDIRRAMGHKDRKLLESYKSKFITNATEIKGCPLKEADDIWNKLEKFALYGFNKSHAAAYAITGYISQWLKINYPIQFWTAAFEFAKEDDIPFYLSEIKKTGDLVKIKPPDINKSSIKFTTDFEKGFIYWSISGIRNCGDVSTEVIMNERNINGNFFSFEEFIQRVPKAKINKTVVENLVLAGCFDEIENIKRPIERINILKKYNKYRSKKEKSFIEDNITYLNKDWWWLLQQKSVSNLAYFKYKEIFNQNQKGWNIDKYFDINKLNFHDEDYASVRKKVVVCGVVSEIIIKNSKKGEFAQIKIENNYDFIWIIFWSEIWEQFKQQIIESEKKILIINGCIAYDNYKKENVLQTEDSTQIEIYS
jgi:DNA polymerase-3 subunit alpha